MPSKKQLPTPVMQIVAHFAELEDPRIERTKCHSLESILVMSICAVICGADGWDEIAVFSKLRASWFATILDLPNGTPSADTFRRVFERLDPMAFERCLRRWVESLGRSYAGDVIAVDGKSIKRAFDEARPTVPLHMLHVWSTRENLIVGQRVVEGAPGEVRGLLEMLELLDIKGATVTADANSCTAKVTKGVREREADYVLALKGNRGKLHKFAVEVAALSEARGFRGIRMHRTKDRAHGRREERTVRVFVPKAWPVSRTSAWTDLCSLAVVDRVRTVKGKTSRERSYYVSNLPPDAARIAHAIREHWSVENNLHWSLDTTFGEDDRRIRDMTSGANIAFLARLGLMLLKREPTANMSLKSKRKACGWSADFLARTLCSGISAD